MDQNADRVHIGAPVEDSFIYPCLVFGFEYETILVLSFDNTPHLANSYFYAAKLDQTPFFLFLHEFLGEKLGGIEMATAFTGACVFSPLYLPADVSTLFSPLFVFYLFPLIIF